MLHRIAFAAVLLGILLRSAFPADRAPDRTPALVAILQSDAAFFDKARACQQLGEIGTAEAVPSLAALLSDPKLGAYARSGLEGIPGPTAAAALRSAADQLRGALLAGVVNSLGVLRDREAVPTLSRLAVDPASGVVKEALLALANIATTGAVQRVQEAFTTGPEASRADAASACLLAADRLRATGHPQEALALYDLIRTKQAPLSCRVGATRGSILVRSGPERVTFLVAQLHSDEPPIRNAALLTIREVPDDGIATALNAEVEAAQADLQLELLLAIADCHNSQSVSAVKPMAESSDPDVRQRALAVLGRLGPAAAPTLIATLRSNQPELERKQVLSSLKALRGSAVDQELVEALKSATSPEIQIGLVQLLEARDVTAAAPDLLKPAKTSDARLSLAALSALKSLAGVDELPALLDLAAETTDQDRQEAVIDALTGLCRRAGPAASDAVLQRFQEAGNATVRGTWVSVLARVGYSKSLPALEAAATGTDSTLANRATRELSHWPDPAPVPALLRVLESSSDPARKQRAFGSVLDLATTALDERQTDPGTIAAWLRSAGRSADSVPEKRRLLSALGRLETVESFRILQPYLGDASVEAEASVAVLQIAPALIHSEEGANVCAAVERMAMKTDETDIRTRARQLTSSLSKQSAMELFDGRTLQGWEGNPKVWRVEDGVIVGGWLAGNPRNEFLATIRPYTNFILRLEYKLVGSEGFVNSGVQFRSVRIANPPNEMSGYQADIGAGYSGCLYDESRRNTFLSRPAENEVQRIEKPGDWNHYELRGEGPHIQLWLNGIKTVDYAEGDSAIPQRGLIGLQIHGGNKAQVYFRNILIEER